MMKAKRIISVLVLCALLLMGSSWNAITTTNLDWHVLGGGGGQVSNGSLVLEGTSGQALTGSVSEASTQLCAGYWCGSEDIYVYFYKVYLPIISRE
jgi:hypothetical protein